MFSIMYGFVSAVFIKQLIAWANRFTAATLSDNSMELNHFKHLSSFWSKQACQAGRSHLAIWYLTKLHYVLSINLVLYEQKILRYIN